MTFANQVAVITGASSGIGWALAKVLAAEGCKIGLVARRQEKLQALVQEMGVAAGNVAYVAADVGNRAQAVAAIRGLAAQLGPVDLLIANAGVGMPTRLDPMNVTDIEAMFRVNMLGVVYAIEAVLPAMLGRRRGHLAAVSSLAGYKGMPGESAYCASKAAVNYYLEGLRIHLRDKGIAVTTLCPGFVRTPMTAMNEFHMPWLLEADEAARRMVRALHRRRKVYNFPWQTSLLMHLTRWLPDWVMARSMRTYNEHPPFPPSSEVSDQRSEAHNPNAVAGPQATDLCSRSDGLASLAGACGVGPLYTKTTPDGFVFPMDPTLEGRMALPLQGRTVALAEGRQLEELAQMLEREGATTLRCPMVSILDAPDPEPVIAWLRELIAGRLDYVILMTGEALRRLLGFAERAGLREQVITALGKTRTVTRGPKPVRALKEVELAPSRIAEAPTTDGVIATLRQEPLQGRTIGLTLYGAANPTLVQFLEQAGASVRTVLPYVYAPATDADHVAQLIERMAREEVDVVVFTSSPQVDRLYEVASERGLQGLLQQGLQRTQVAAVGPVVAENLRQKGAPVHIRPEQGFVMKNLVQQIKRALETTAT